MEGYIIISGIFIVWLAGLLVIVGYKNKLMGKIISNQEVQIKNLEKMISNYRLIDKINATKTTK